jgi:hypothetical protein
MQVVARVRQGRLQNLFTLPARYPGMQVSTCFLRFLNALTLCACVLAAFPEEMPLPSSYLPASSDRSRRVPSVGSSHTKNHAWTLPARWGLSLSR